MTAQPPIVYVSGPPQRMNPLVAMAIGLALAIAAQWFGIPIPTLPPSASPPSWSPPRPTPPTPAPPAIPPTPPAPAPVPPQQPPANALAAIGRIQFGNAGCTATVIEPRRPDGRYDVLTAAHCISGVGQQGTMRLRDGRTVGLRVVAIDKRADACWCVTTTDVASLPTARLADRTPAAGSRIWHAGFGVDVPGNREDGTVTAGPNSDGQIEMRISVSSGDSGGALCLSDSDMVVSCVCCTTIRGAVGRVWGASPEAIAALRPRAVSADEWLPLDVPMLTPRGE